ncbi:hypothetical protein [Anabaena lutea]|uniref:Restriction endonuclease n=1 Tax=Anabaena lutea FACHB-196 TaxID=2692881 RepID=A0ABR8FJ20_9NOST|nr:hypothetical protein [Anabaena lutea]MBD2570166.1 hypothetical protein [Anabaena lutea FACHB-196]
MKELTWQKVLQAQQQDFIQRLKYSLSNPEYDNLTLSHFNYHPFYCERSYPSERIIISALDEEKIDRFCGELAEKYNHEPAVDSYMNYKIGKLGEEAVKVYLNNLITGVDYKIHSGGDGGIDFLVKNNKHIGIQVKTKTLNRISLRDICKNKLSEDDVDECGFYLWQDRMTRIDSIKWNIQSEEIHQNKVLICILLMNYIVVDKISSECDCIIAGFKPTAEIKYSGDFKMQDLLYSGGIRPFLESLN